MTKTYKLPIIFSFVISLFVFGNWAYHSIPHYRDVTHMEICVPEMVEHSTTSTTVIIDNGMWLNPKGEMKTWETDENDCESLPARMSVRYNLTVSSCIHHYESGVWACYTEVKEKYYW